MGDMKRCIIDILLRDKYRYEQTKKNWLQGKREKQCNKSKKQADRKPDQQAGIQDRWMETGRQTRRKIHR